MAKIFKSQVKDLKSRFKFGIEVPRGVKEATMLDKKNGDNKWMEAISKEKNQPFDFETFEILGKGEKAPIKQRTQVTTLQSSLSIHWIIKIIDNFRL